MHLNRGKINMKCFSIPERSLQLQAAFTRIQALGSSQFFVERHVSAVAKTVTAIFIATFDTVAYAEKALAGFFIAIIQLEVSQAFEEFSTNGRDTFSSLTATVMLVVCAVGGIFKPRAILGKFPSFFPTPLDKSEALRTEIGQRGTLLGEIKNGIKDAHKTISDLKAEIQKLKAQKETLEEKIKQLKPVLKETSNGIEDGGKTVSLLKAQVQELTDQRDVLRNEILLFMPVLKDTKSNLANSNDTISSLKREIQELAAQKESLQNEIDTRMPLLERIEEGIDTSNEIISKMKTELRDLTTQRETLGKEIQQRNPILVQITKSIAASEQTISELKDEIEHLTTIKLGLQRLSSPKAPTI